MRNFLVLVLALTVSGCATKTTTDSVVQKNYSLGRTVQTTIGAPMVSQYMIKYIEEKRWVGILASSDGWERKKHPTDDSFREELIYTGRSGDTINISYREYRKDFARPAFFQAIRYDLSQSRNISFKNYQILVLSATNQVIEFQVMSD